MIYDWSGSVYELSVRSLVQLFIYRTLEYGASNLGALDEGGHAKSLRLAESRLVSAFCLICFFDNCSFSNAGPYIFNSLFAALRMCTIPNIFCQLKNHYFQAFRPI